MRLKIQNIGMIKNANINLDGLTVIAGENDTGKSTVGKILFCLIKTVSRYQEKFSESKEHKINEILERLYFTIRKNAKISDEKSLNNLRDIFSIDSYLHSFDDNSYIKVLQNYIYNLTIDTDIQELLLAPIAEIHKIMIEPEDDHKYIQSALNKVFRSEFDSNILKYGCKNGKIELYEGELLLLDIAVEENNKIVLANNCQPIYLDDATFIETPLILNNHDLLLRSITGLNDRKSTSRRLGIPYTTLHTKDLFDKLKEASLLFDLIGVRDNSTIQDNIKHLINGDLVYHANDKDFKYIKNNITIPIKNTATGIKSFGIIQLLADNDFINEKSFLILDEPEIHLHPKWQLEYAKLISILVKNNVPVLVTSHSPYMIEALQRFNEGNSNVDFYIADNGNIDKIENDNELTLSEIFTKLSEPFEEFDKMDAKKL